MRSLDTKHTCFTCNTTIKEKFFVSPEAVYCSQQHLLENEKNYTTDKKFYPFKGYASNYFNWNKCAAVGCCMKCNNTFLNKHPILVILSSSHMELLCRECDPNFVPKNINLVDAIGKEKFFSFPKLKIDKTGCTDYIDFLVPSDFKESIVCGIDPCNRPFLSFKVKHNLHNDPTVFTIFQRYSPPENVIWTVGGNSNALGYFASRINNFNLPEILHLMETKQNGPWKLVE